MFGSSSTTSDTGNNIGAPSQRARGKLASWGACLHRLRRLPYPARQGPGRHGTARGASSSGTEVANGGGGRGGARSARPVIAGRLHHPGWRRDASDAAWEHPGGRSPRRGAGHAASTSVAGAARHLHPVPRGNMRLVVWNTRQKRSAGVRAMCTGPTTHGSSRRDAPGNHAGRLGMRPRAHPLERTGLIGRRRSPCPSRARRRSRKGPRRKSSGAISAERAILPPLSSMFPRVKPSGSASPQTSDSSDPEYVHVGRGPIDLLQDNQPDMSGGFSGRVNSGTKGKDVEKSCWSFATCLARDRGENRTTLGHRPSHCTSREGRMAGAGTHPTPGVQHRRRNTVRNGEASCPGMVFEAYLITDSFDSQTEHIHVFASSIR